MWLPGTLDHAYHVIELRKLRHDDRKIRQEDKVDQCLDVALLGEVEGGPALFTVSSGTEIVKNLLEERPRS